MYYTNQIFTEYVAVNQLVSVGEVVQHMRFPVYKTQTGVAFELYGCDQADALYTTDEGMKKIAEISLSIPRGTIKSTRSYPIEVHMRFGGSELQFWARDKQTGEECETSVKFAQEVRT